MKTRPKDSMSYYTWFGVLMLRFIDMMRLIMNMYIWYGIGRRFG